MSLIAIGERVANWRRESSSFQGGGRDAFVRQTEQVHELANALLTELQALNTEGLALAQKLEEATTSASAFVTQIKSIQAKRETHANEKKSLEEELAAAEAEVESLSAQLKVVPEIARIDPVPDEETIVQEPVVIPKKKKRNQGTREVTTSQAPSNPKCARKGLIKQPIPLPRSVAESDKKEPPPFFFGTESEEQWDALRIDYPQSFNRLLLFARHISSHRDSELTRGCFAGSNKQSEQAGLVFLYQQPFFAFVNFPFQPTKRTIVHMIAIRFGHRCSYSTLEQVLRFGGNPELKAKDTNPDKNWRKDTDPDRKWRTPSEMLALRFNHEGSHNLYPLIKAAKIWEKWKDRKQAEPEEFRKTLLSCKFSFGGEEVDPCPA